MAHLYLLEHIRKIEEFIDDHVFYETEKSNYDDMLIILEDIGRNISKFLVLEEDFRKMNNDDKRIYGKLKFETSLRKTLLTQKYLICGTNQVLIQLYMKRIDIQYIGYVVCVRTIENEYTDFHGLLSHDEFDAYCNSDDKDM